MTRLPTLAEVGALAATAAGRDSFSGSEVRAFAAAHGITPRTLRRYEIEGFVAGPERAGRGRGRGAEFRYPARVSWEVALVAGARRETHSLRGIRHWLWWAGYPIEWERWRADRLEDLAGLAVAELWTSAKTPAERDREAAKLVNELGKQRPFPLRGRGLRTTARRDQVVQVVFDARVLGVAPSPAEALTGPDATIGDALDHAFTGGLRRAGWLEGAPVGTQIAELLVTVPNSSEGFRWLEALTEADARRLWRIATEFETRGFFGSMGAPPLRLAPAYSGLCLFYLHWAIPDAILSELEALSPTTA